MKVPERDRRRLDTADNIVQVLITEIGIDPVIEISRIRMDDQKIIFDALGHKASHVDELVRATGLSAPRVQITLTTLTLLGLAMPDDRGAFSRIG